MGKDSLSFIDFYLESKSTNDFRSCVAVSIAIFSLILSIITITSDYYKQDLDSTDILINNVLNSYESKIIGQNSYKIALDVLEINLREVTQKNTKALLDEKISSYKNIISAYENDDKEGKINLFEKLKELELRKQSLIIDLRYLGYAQISSTISIVIGCVGLIKNGKIGYALFGVSLGLICLSILVVAIILL